MALLSGARNENNSRLAQQVHDRMEKVFSRSNDLLTSASILLGNVYGAIGDIEKASDIRIRLAKSGAKRRVGLSWIITDGQLYVSLNRNYSSSIKNHIK